MPEITEPFSKITLSDIIHRLAASRRVLIVSHTNPDGDTLGSAAALAEIVSAMGSEARCTAPESPSERLSFIIPPERLLIPLSDDGTADSFDTVCAVDIASPSQLGSLSWLAERGQIDFMIDHHATGEPFAPYLTDSDASAVGEIIYRLYRESLDAGLIPPLPNALRGAYTAISSDTGSFKYSNVTPETHLIAAELVRGISCADDGGPSTEELSRTLFGRRTMRDLRAQALTIRNLSVSDDGRIASVLFRRDEYLAEGLSESDLGGGVETPRSLVGVKIALSVRQNASDPNLYKVSSRSNCDTDVAAVCAAFGGGGHPKAAGCSVTASSPEEALSTVTEAFAAALTD